MKLVLVEWDDCSTRMGGWHHLDEMDSVMECFSMGVICKEDEKQIVIANSRNADGRYMETVAIPRGCIKRIRTLKVVTDGKGN